MNKTTPEEAEALAFKHGQQFLTGDKALWFHKEQLAALIDEVRGVDAEPRVKIDLPPMPWRARNLGGITEVLDANGVIVISWMGFDDSRKTFKTRRAITRFIADATHPAPSQPAAPVELPVVAALLTEAADALEWHMRDYHHSHRKGLPEELRDQAAIAAGRKAS